MTAMLRIGVITVLAFVGSWRARADDRSTCYSSDYTNSEQYDAAILACSRLISSSSGAWQAFAYRARGCWNHRKGNTQSAIEDFYQTIRIDPHQVEGYYYRGDVFKDIGEFDRALADYEMVIRKNPAFAAAYFNRGFIYEARGDLAAARREYDLAIATPYVGMDARLTEWAHTEARRRIAALGLGSSGSVHGPNDYPLTTGR
jgi:tetratricopeptide (TPR) repeat protein